MSKFISVLFAAIITLYFVAICAVYVLPRFDYQFIPITYDSADLNLSTGDCLFVRPSSIDKLKPDQIIAYYNNSNSISVYKVSEVNVVTNVATVMLQKTEIKDFTEAVPESKLIGVQLVNLKGCSGLIKFMQSYAGKMVCGIIIGVFAVIKVAFKRNKEFAR